MRLDKDSSTSPFMVKYIIPLLRDIQDDLCTHCQEPLDQFQLHHKRYGDDITVYDLELVHGECHSQSHGVSGVRGTQRTFSVL